MGMSTAVLIVAFSYAYLGNGVSLWSMGIQASSHALASLLLAIRFVSENKVLEGSQEGSSQGQLRKRRKKYLVREQGLNMAMAVVMLISSAALLFKAFRKLKFWNKWYK